VKQSRGTARQKRANAIQRGAGQAKSPAKKEQIDWNQKARAQKKPKTIT